MTRAIDIFNNSVKELPEIKYTLPSTGEELFLRPFTTRDQKAVLKAMEQQDQTLIGEAFDAMLKKCVLNNNFDPNKLITKDRECLLIFLRQTSIKEEFQFSFTCRNVKCRGKNNKEVDLSDLEYEELVEKAVVSSKEVDLVGFNVSLVLGMSTREDEKNILKYAKKNSGKKALEGEISQTELLNAAYASVIKGLVTISEKEVENKEGEKEVVKEKIIVNVPFDERIEMLEKLIPEDKEKIHKYFEELKSYGYNLTLSDLTCKHCGEVQDVEMDWQTFFL